MSLIERSLLLNKTNAGGTQFFHRINAANNLKKEDDHNGFVSLRIIIVLQHVIIM